MKEIIKVLRLKSGGLGTLSFECNHCHRPFYFDQALFERAWNYLKCFSCEGLMFVSRDLREKVALRNAPPRGLPVFDTLPEEIRVQKSFEKVCAVPRPVLSTLTPNSLKPSVTTPTSTFTNSESLLEKSVYKTPVEGLASTVRMKHVPVRSKSVQPISIGIAFRFFMGLAIGAVVGAVVYFIFQGKAAWQALQNIPN